MTTLSEAFAAATADTVDETALDRPRVHARMRARGYRSLPVAGKVADWAAVAGADFASAWWTPASLPTIQTAWAERMPDRGRVPGDNGLLYTGWVVYNHTIGLAVPAAVLAVVGVLTPLVWVARHPARLVLAALIAAPLVVLLVW